MKKLISLNYCVTSEEVKPQFLSAYHDIDSITIKLDCLQDSIHYLEEEYNRLIKIENYFGGNHE
jgi:hypothetical protein